MSNETLEKIKRLPPEKLKELDAFVDELLAQSVKSSEGESIRETRIKNMGWAKGEIWMAEDFNDTPEDFKDYL
jgi:hypothetical protein